MLGCPFSLNRTLHMNTEMTRHLDKFKVLDIIIALILIFMMDMIAFWYSSMNAIPYPSMSADSWMIGRYPITIL